MYVKKFLAAALSAAMWIMAASPVSAEPAVTTNSAVTVSAPSVILMESSTGQVIYEQNSTEKRSPASVTKIMTLLLTFEAIDSGKASLSDQVIVSEHASSMGGSQVFLAQNESQTLETMIKCITVASGNDASVAVAEHIAGSEEAFVNLMNRRAQELGMNDTHFEDCCGLTDSDNHYSTAKDVAIMSRELTTKHPQIFDYTKIWMEDITHETAQGTSTFTLTNTNKLMKQYPYATGLKTGSTSKAMFCLSATASKDGIDLIAVVMGAPDNAHRVSDAKTLLTYGFNVCDLYIDSNAEDLAPVKVEKGVEDEVDLVFLGEFRYLDTAGSDLSSVVKVLDVPESVEAPVTEGQQAGVAKYYLNGTEIGSVPVLYGGSVEKARYIDYLKKIWGNFLL